MVGNLALTIFLFLDCRNTLDPLLCKLTLDYVDDTDLALRLSALYKVRYYDIWLFNSCCCTCDSQFLFISCQFLDKQIALLTGTKLAEMVCQVLDTDDTQSIRFVDLCRELKKLVKKTVRLLLLLRLRYYHNKGHGLPSA